MQQNGISTNHYRGGELQAQIVINGDAQHVLLLHEDLTIETFKLRYKGAKHVLEWFVDMPFCSLFNLSTKTTGRLCVAINSVIEW